MVRKKWKKKIWRHTSEKNCGCPVAYKIYYKTFEQSKMVLWHGLKKILKYGQKVVTDDQPIASYRSSEQIFYKEAIKVEEKSFNLRCESKKSVNLSQSYVHLKIAKNDQKWSKF